jgi:hypothetical protein
MLYVEPPTPQWLAYEWERSIVNMHTFCELLLDETSETRWSTAR